MNEKTKLEIAKQIIKKHYHKAMYGLFNSHGWTGDVMYTIYYNEELMINICYDYEYFEVFGLSHIEFANLERFYEELVERNNNE